MAQLDNQNKSYNLIDVEVISGDLYLLNKLIKTHNDYRSKVEGEGANIQVYKAMFLHRFHMNSPYTEDDNGTDDFLGYGLATIAVLPHITKSSIQTAIDNDSEMYNRLFVNNL